MFWQAEPWPMWHTVLFDQSVWVPHPYAYQHTTFSVIRDGEWAKAAGLPSDNRESVEAFYLFLKTHLYYCKYLHSFHTKCFFPGSPENPLFNDTNTFNFIRPEVSLCLLSLIKFLRAYRCTALPLLFLRSVEHCLIGCFINKDWLS